MRTFSSGRSAPGRGGQPPCHGLAYGVPGAVRERGDGPGRTPADSTPGWARRGQWLRRPSAALTPRAMQVSRALSVLPADVGELGALLRACVVRVSGSNYGHQRGDPSVAPNEPPWSPIGDSNHPMPGGRIFRIGRPSYLTWLCSAVGQEERHEHPRNRGTRRASRERDLRERPRAPTGAGLSRHECGATRESGAATSGPRQTLISLHLRTRSEYDECMTIAAELP